MVTTTQRVSARMRERRRTYKLVIAAFVYLSFICVSRIYDVNGEVKKWDSIDTAGSSGRHLLNIYTTTDANNTNCTPRAVDEFPPDFLSREEKEQGGIAIHIFIALYMFASLAIICDDYFVPSLEHICTALNLQHDVAGATFMAAGSSAPELATSVIGVFIAKTQIGTGTIVGSAVFNILFIIALCGLFGGAVIELTWFPLLRDCLVYLLSVGALVIVIYDGEIHWYEGLIMVLMYLLYIVLMYFNPVISGYFIKRFDRMRHKPSSKVIGFKNDHANATTKILPDEESDLLGVGTKYGNYGQESGEHSTTESNDDEEYESPWEFPDGIFARFFWIVMLPAKAIIFILVPDCRKPGIWQKLYMFTFIMSVVVISGLSYVMVWMVAIIGDIATIPDTVMGLTFLAAGTSVPDALASLFVCRDGYGDMAVSNSIGSNIFDILLCLGLPWLLYSTILENGEPIKTESTSLTFTALCLLSTVLFLIGGIGINGWKLDKKFGVICLFVYAIFMTFSCMFELNVFFDVNLPPCPRDT